MCILCSTTQEGKALKLLATAARLDVEDFLQKKVYLEVPIYIIFLFCIYAYFDPKTACLLFHLLILSFK